ncbi:DUF7289 family protein [Halorubrum sp. DTA46]|uniref:DUF7289 family protein n=1 Tax=Halorubrum sp. DTA46 TaxID=3402162 RepID=UPI003AAA85C0
MKSRERAQSEVIGVVLLLAITIAAVTVTVATGSAALGLVTDDARSSSVENGMSQLSSQSSLVALGETNARRFDLGSVDGGQLTLDEDAGRVAVWIERGGGDVETVYNGTIGTMEYEGQRRDIAMQGGGVWAMQNDRGRMISPPEYHYRGSTLTFPVVKLTGDERSPSGSAGVVRRGEGNATAVNATNNPLQNGTVVVEVQSKYYEGWYDFFSQRAEGEVTKDDANRTTTARLVVPQEIPLDKALSTGMGSDSFSGNSEVDDRNYTTGNTHPSPASIIDSQLATAESNGTDVSNCLNKTCTAGTYYAGGDVTITNDTYFDTSGGNITVAIDGDLDVGGHDLQINDETTNNGVKYYIAGDLKFQNPTIGTTSPAIEASRTQFYVNGDVAAQSSGGGNARIDAIIYAPNADFETNGNVAIRGTVVFNEIDVGGNVDIQSDPDLVDLTLRITGGPGQNPITYLHVSENVVELDFDR